MDTVTRMDLSASLMCADQLNIIKHVTSLIKLGVDAFHFDIMDGNFVNNLAMNFDIVRSIRPLTRISFDAHLMVEQPSKYFDRLIESGVDIIIFHIECTENIQENIDYLKSRDVKVGLALHTQTPVIELYKYLPYIDHVLLMNVKTGFSGQKFDDRVYQKSNELYSYIKSNNYSLRIISDGGITLNHIEQLYNNGVDMVVAGTSLLFNQSGFSKNLSNFNNIRLYQSNRKTSIIKSDSSEIKYKAAVLHEINNLKLNEKILRPLKNGEVAIKVMSCGICGSDLVRVYKRGMYSNNLVPGHEFSGIIIKTNEVNSELLNKSVTVFPLISCKKCNYCKLEKYNLCENYDYLGSRSDGGFAEIVIVPIENLIILPNNINYDEAALLEPLAVSYHAVRKIPDLTNSNVLVLGLGPIGILAGMFCKKFGASKIVGIDRNLYKHEIAKKMGFSECFMAGSAKIANNIDVIIDACGATGLLGDCINLLKKEGFILLLANYEGGLVFSNKAMSEILRGEFRVYSSWNSTNSDLYGNEWKICANYLSNREIDIKPLITQTYPLSDITNIFNKIKNKEIDYSKIIINPN